MAMQEIRMFHGIHKLKFSRKLLIINLLAEFRTRTALAKSIQHGN